MTHEQLNENTLGVVVGRRRVEAGAARSPRQARALSATLGTNHLGVGIAIVAGIICVHGLTLLAASWNSYPDPLPVIAAWLLLAALLGAVAATVAIRGETMPDWLFALVVTAVFGVIALDLIAVWPLGNIASHASASLCASAGLLISVTLRRAREIVIATLLVGAVLSWAMITNSTVTTVTLPSQLTVICAAMFPPLLATWLVHRFRRLVQTELDRVLVQSTISAPRFAVGMLASEELARLDLAAEELLDSVATGTLQLPLESRWASRAASLATELRLHLIEGRRETWLYHAITESETLGRSATLIDRSSLAGLLDRSQRDGLLAAIWLLVSERETKPVNVTVTIGPTRVDEAPRADRLIVIPIVLETTGMSLTRVDPAIWEAIARVGEHTGSTHDTVMHIAIDCLVQNPADH